MGILTYMKIVGVLLLIGVASYFVLNYKHMQSKIKILEVQVEEQHRAIEFYEKGAAIDKETANVHEEIKKAVEGNDTAKLRELYDRLRKHQRSDKTQTPNKTNNDGDESKGD